MRFLGRLLKPVYFRLPHFASVVPTGAKVQFQSIHGSLITTQDIIILVQPFPNKPTSLSQDEANLHGSEVTHVKGPWKMAGKIHVRMTVVISIEGRLT